MRTNKSTFHNSSARSDNGFSLIEVMVSLSIFTIVVTICVSALYTLIEANAQARNAQSIATNLSFTLDSMTREIRTGRDYYCGPVADLPTEDEDAATHPTQDCDGPAGGEGLSFNEGGQSLTGADETHSRRIAYRLSEDGRLQRRIGVGVNDFVFDDNDWFDLTSDDIFIEELRFYVEGSERGDEVPPIITVAMRGLVGSDPATQSEFSLQTSIAQRLLDI